MIHPVKWNGQTVCHMNVTHQNDWIERHWMKGEFYEKRVLQYMEDLDVDASGTFLNIGAHRGNHAVFAAVVLGFKYMVLVEPSATNYAALQANLQYNTLDMTRIRSFKLAVHPLARERPLDLYDFPESNHAGPNTGMFRPAGHEEDSAEHVIQIPPYCIKGLTDGFPPVTLAVVDTEGVEGPVAGAVMAEQCPVIAGNKVHTPPGYTETSLGVSHYAYVPNGFAE